MLSEGHDPAAPSITRTMLHALRLAPAASDDHERAFLERYRRLYGRALRLTGGREDAEDLVQDAFVQFVLSRTPLEDIRNLDAYLFTILQYLHASDGRRAARRPGDSLEVIDHDSAEIALRAADASRRYLACEELGLICDCACARSGSSRAGSALLLRYFHGYYVREIALLFQSPPSNVDGLLHVARREAKAWVSERPRAGRRPPATRRACLDGLRAGIFARAHGTCFSPAWFEEVYLRPNGRKPLAASDLAEMVTCPRCLDSANTTIGLPRLLDRYPTDTLGPDRRSGGPTGTSSQPPGPPGTGEPGQIDGGGPCDGGETPGDRPGDGGSTCSAGERAGARAPGDLHLQRLRRAAEDVREHRPRELFLAVNGLELASQRTGGGLNEQRVTVPGGEAIAFIEVFSEQQVRMLFLEVQAAPEGAIEQCRRVELAGGRT
ncbi:MAG: RNA polymerase sigma factor, partial [Acidobacteria bacterium]